MQINEVELGTVVVVAIWCGYCKDLLCETAGICFFVVAKCCESMFVAAKCCESGFRGGEVLRK